MLTIEQAKKEDLSSVVDIHSKAFPISFLTSIGKRFLSQFYFRYLSKEDSFLLVCKHQGIIIGFLSGNFSAKKKYFIQNLKLIFFLFPALFSNFIFFVNRSLSVLKNNKEISIKMKNGALISSIAVDPKYRSLGVGKLLLQAFENRAKLSNHKFVYLTTEKNHNNKTLAFYKKADYVTFFEYEVYKKRKMLVLYKSLLY